MRINTDARPDIGNEAVHLNTWPKLANVAMLRAPARYERSAGAVHIVSLSFVPASTVEDLHTVIFPVRHIQPAIIVSDNIMDNVELPRS